MPESMPEIKYSIVICATNQIMHTVNCIESIFRHTENFEVIFVDNNSNDGTPGYIENLPSDKVKVVRSNKTLTFSEANNAGIKLCSGEYIIFLNNDTIVSPNWIDNMESHFKNVPLKNIGAVGPVSSMSNGKQMVGVQDPIKWNKEHKGRWVHSGILYGWCIMVKKCIIDEIGGFDERFVNGWEDNDLCLRIQLAGYKMIIAYDTYIDHVGQGTLSKTLTTEEYMKAGMVNREKYFDKWYEDKPKKLVAVYRTNCGKWLEASLKQTSKFADNIILHLVRTKDKKFFGCDDSGETCEMDNKQYSEYLQKQYPKICKVGFYDGAFQEDYERNWLLQEALKLHEQGEADWCISIDDDEIYEDKFIDRVQKYMSPRNPEIMAYWCNWRTIWDKSMGKEYYRSDSTFGKFMNYRFFRLIKNQEIFSSHPEGHHCGSAPYFADQNLMWIGVRVKHLGYDSPEQRQRKYNFYQENDHFKSKQDIGYEDYSHLIDRNVRLQEYDPNNGITLTAMVKNEEDHILGMLESVQYLVDEFVIVDTGSTDNTIKILEQFKSYCPVPVKILSYPWDDVYSRPRNFAKRHATQKWVMFMDADEVYAPEDVHKLFELSEKDKDAVTFHVINYSEPIRKGVKPKYYSSQSCRLFRNLDTIYFTGIVHETVDDSIVMMNIKGKVRGEMADFPLHHFGYLKKKKKVDHKLDYYEVLNAKQIEITEEKDARPFFNIAMHYMERERQKDALKMFQKSLDVSPNFYHSNNEMASINLRSAKEFLKRSIKTMPNNHPFIGKARDIVKFLDDNDFGFYKRPEYAGNGN